MRKKREEKKKNSHCAWTDTHNNHFNRRLINAVNVKLFFFYFRILYSPRHLLPYSCLSTFQFSYMLDSILREWQSKKKKTIFNAVMSFQGIEIKNKISDFVWK